ncbi:MAG: beta-ketoacyl synthase chain length factor [Victivallales bacterium]|nr:beta-ketoacyl synthase chain length factor [Victivallales bacterium]
MFAVLHNSLDWTQLPDEQALQKARLRHRLRRADRYTSLCIAAADALLEGNELHLETALVTVSSFGPSETAFQTIEDILDVPAEEVSPTRFSHSVENAACSYLGVAFGFHGPVFALAGFNEASVATAQQLAKTLLEQNLAPAVLLLNVTCSSIVTAHAKKYYPERFPDGISERVRGWYYITY